MKPKDPRLKDIEPDTIRVLSDRVKEEFGFGLIHLLKLEPAKRCFLLHGYAKIHMDTLRAVFPHCLAMRDTKYSHNYYIPVVLFEKDAIKTLFQLAGIRAPSKYYRYGTQATKIIQISISD